MIGWQNSSIRTSRQKESPVCIEDERDLPDDGFHTARRIVTSTSCGFGGNHSPFRAATERAPDSIPSDLTDLLPGAQPQDAISHRDHQEA
jgi:hypothetical protein